MTDFSLDLRVRWADLDPNGHVRHSAYYDYGTVARVAYLEERGVGIRWMREHGVGPVLFREEAQFRRELNFGDIVTVNVLLTGLSKDHRKWSLRHEIRAGDEVCALLNLDGAWFDLKSRKVSAPPPELSSIFEQIAHAEDFAWIESGKSSP